MVGAKSSGGREKSAICDRFCVLATVMCQNNYKESIDQWPPPPPFCVIKHMALRSS